MLLHQARVLLVVHPEAALARELLRQLDREAERRLQREGVLARDLAAGRGLLEDLHPALERLGEALLLGREHLPDLARGAARAPDRPRPSCSITVSARPGRNESSMPIAQAVLRGAADDPAQHVAAALVRRRDALRDEEGHAAAVIREHAMRLRRVGALAVGDAGLLGDPLHDQLVAVGVVDGRRRSARSARCARARGPCRCSASAGR